MATAKAGARVEIEAVGRYAIDGDASSIVLERAEDPLDPQVALECALGVPLMLSLALRGVWIIHASAVLVDHRVVVLAGPSGAGKSTLAARLDGMAGCTRIADDLLALRGAGDTVLALPAFPQFKLSAADQPKAARAEVGTMGFLQPGDSGGRALRRRMKTVEKTIAVAANTVAARAFPPAILQRHLHFCRRAAASVDMFEIAYPRNRPALENLSEWAARAGGRG